MGKVLDKRGHIKHLDDGKERSKAVRRLKVGWWDHESLLKFVSKKFCSNDLNDADYCHHWRGETVEAANPLTGERGTYGIFMLNGQYQYAHRLVKDFHEGPPKDFEPADAPVEICLERQCGSTLCVNPGHLRYTHSDDVDPSACNPLFAPAV